MTKPKPSPSDLAGTRGHPYDTYYTRIQFTTSTQMPHLVYRACLATGTLSNTAYYQRAICEALARDLGLDLDDLLAQLPPHRGPANHLFDPDQHTMSRQSRQSRDVAYAQHGGRQMTGPGNTIEEVR